MSEELQALGILFIIVLLLPLTVGNVFLILPLPLASLVFGSMFIASLAWWWNKFIKGKGVFQDILESGPSVFLAFGVFAGVIALAIFAASLVPTTFGKIAFMAVLTFFTGIAIEIGKRR